jgi:hypothetical protein
MRINPKLLELIESVFDNVDDQKCAITYAACIELDTLDTLYSWGVFKDNSDEHKFRVALMERDIETDSLQVKYKLKYPLWVNEVEEDLWDDFYKWLHVNPKLKSYSAKLRTTPEAKKSFRELQLIKEFDLDRFKAATEQYYLETGEYSLALPKFLVELGRGKYEGFVKEKSNVL